MVDDGRMNGWRVGGICCAALGWILWGVVQLVNHDVFPPEISVSQFGLHGTGWVFSVWVVVLATAPLLLLRFRPVPGPAKWFLWIGYAGAWLMAVVRTDAGGAQVTITADAHMLGSVLTLVFLPLGMMNALAHAANPWRTIAFGLLFASLAAGTLLLLAAAGMDTAGVGAPSSWAFWQGVLVILEMSLTSLYALAVTTIAATPGRPRPAAPVQSSIQ